MNELKIKTLDYGFISYLIIEYSAKVEILSLNEISVSLKIDKNSSQEDLSREYASSKFFNYNQCMRSILMDINKLKNSK